MQVCEATLNGLGWRRSDYDNITEIAPTDRDSRLKTSIIQNGGKLILGRYSYMISQDGKWFKRRRVQIHANEW
jgi:hypothetical protein